MVPAVEYVQRFFESLPAFFVQMWDFGEGFYGLAVGVISLVLAVVFLFLARLWRDDHGWLSAVLGIMGGAVVFWWVFGILPSAMILFLDGARDQFEGVLLPTGIPGVENLYQVTRDTLVVGEHAIGVLAFAIAALMLQRRYPRSLAEGEEKGPSSGGYK